MFLMATLADGRRVVSEFTELSKVQKYALDVFSGRSTFNAWRVVGTVHPASGERVLMRERELIDGRHIVSLQQVEPKPGLTMPHEYEPSRFQPVVLMKEGEYGLWRVPTGTTAESEGVVAMPDVDYPQHRDARSLRDFVILRAANEAEDISEVRYYTDGQPAPTTVGAVEDEDDSWDSDFEPVPNDDYDDDDPR